MPKPKVSVIIPTMAGREKMLKRLIASLPKDVEVIVVPDEDILLAAKRNRGAGRSKGEYLIFIDDDNYLEEDAIGNMMAYHNKEIGVMGMMACYSDKKMMIADGGSRRHYTSGLMTGLGTNKRIYDWWSYPYEVDEVANAFMIPRHIFNEVGGFDEVNFPIDLDEADICKRIKNMGYKVMMDPKAICYHESQTYSPIPDFRRPLNAYMMARNKVLYQKKHLNTPKLLIYFLIFLPMFLVGYTLCLLYRGKPNMVLQYWKGTLDGILGRFKNQYQS